MLALAGVAALTGVVYAAARWACLRAADVRPRQAGIASAAALVTIGVALVVGGLLAVGNPVTKVRDEARAFRDLDARSTAQSGTASPRVGATATTTGA